MLMMIKREDRPCMVLRKPEGWGGLVLGYPVPYVRGTT